MNFMDITANNGNNIMEIIPEFIKPKLSVMFAPDGERARKVISRSNVKATGKYPSWKTGRMMHYESPNERNSFRLFDVCPEVKFYREQPCVVRYQMDGVDHLHYPDNLVELQSKKKFWVRSKRQQMRPRQKLQKGLLS